MDQRPTPNVIMAMSEKIIAVSKNRYNGGVKVKRAYGSATVTTFWVFRAEDEKDPSRWVEIDGFGPTPGDRKTYAIKKFLSRQ